MYASNELNLLNMDIHILCAAYVNLGPWWHAENINSPFTRIYMVTDGKGELSYADNKIVMHPGHIYIIPAGLTFSFKCDDRLSKSYFHISVPTPSRYDLFERLPNIIEYEDSKSVQRIHSLLSDGDISSSFEIKAYIYDVVSKCVKRLEDTRIERYSDLVTSIISYVEKNLSSSLSTEKIANHFLVSASKIRKTFRRETGTSIGTYIYDRVLFRAEVQVRCTSLSIKEISNNLGFCDQYYFSRCFTKKYGLPPQKYRKQAIV